jgi:hypothetical protein
LVEEAVGRRDQPLVRINLNPRHSLMNYPELNKIIKCMNPLFQKEGKNNQELEYGNVKLIREYAGFKIIYFGKT